MANSIAVAPSILAESVIASLKGKLPALRAFSSVFTAAESGAGKTVQVPLIGTSTATEFSTGGYLTQDDATITAANVTLKHFKVSSRFAPLDVKMYGAQFLANAFVPTASNALAEKCLAEIGALITNANYSANVNTGAALSYAEVVASKGVLDAAKAAEPRAFILNPTYANGLLSDATIIGNSVLGAGILTSGQIGTLAGAAVYQWNSLPTNSENLAGFACGADAIAVASALPMSEIPGFEVANAVDADTGLGVQVLMGQEQSG
ncbi:MAG: hypothetical protein ACO3UX_06195, partial [Candidatus Nanopelagicales bacterium]